MTARVCCSLIAVLLCLSVYLSTIDAKGRVAIKGTVPLDKEWLPAGPSLANAGPAPVAPPKGRPWLPEKPGVCPSNHLRVGICAEMCSHDSNCPKDLKCCSNGCGHQCMPPYREKPGVCPRRTLRIRGVCAELCSHDGDCPNDEKCCSNGCGHQCMAVYKEKPGVCPMTLAGVGGLCAELCVSDIDCPNDEKCCSSICGGRVCTPAR